jgi:biotin transport system substrate-specific component
MATIYVSGVAWLAIAASLSLSDALAFGLWPFLPGDLVKLLAGAALLPLGWRLVSSRASDAHGGTAGPA